MYGTRHNTTYRLGLKQKILSTAIELFNERGVRAVKMDDISSELSISKRTLYEIYENKEELLYECVKNKYEDSEVVLAKIAKDSKTVIDILIKIYRLKVEELKNVHPSFYTEMGKYKKIMAYLDDQNKNRKKQQVEFLKRGISEGYFRTDVNYDLVLQLFDVSSRYVFCNYATINCQMEQLSYNLMFVFLRGFCTLKGVKELDFFLENDEEMIRQRQSLSNNEIVQIDKS